MGTIRERSTSYFGCKGTYNPLTNTGADDTVPLQKALDACAEEGWTLALGRRSYLTTKGLMIGTNVAAKQHSGFAVIGDGVVSDAASPGCPSITVVGPQEAALTIGASVYRGMRIGGFRLMPKPTRESHVYWRPTKESEFSCKYGIHFPDQNHTSLRLDEIYVGPAWKTIAYSGKGYDGNGEFTVFNRVYGDVTTGFFFMAPNTGQSFGHKFYDCLSIPDQCSIDQSGYAAFELGGGGGGFGIEVYGFNSSVLLTGTEKLTSPEQLRRATLVRNNGVDGHILVMGGRNERYTTIYENADGRVGGNVIFKAVDMATMLSSNANPTVIGRDNAKGCASFEQVNGIEPFIAPGGYSEGSFVNLAIPAGDRSQYMFRDSRFSRFDQVSNKRRPFKVTCGSTPQSLLQFENCLATDERGRDADILFSRQLRKPADLAGGPWD